MQDSKIHCCYIKDKDGTCSWTVEENCEGELGLSTHQGCYVIIQVCPFCGYRIKDNNEHPS